MSKLSVVGNCSVDLVLSIDDDVLTHYGLKRGESNNALYVKAYETAFHEILSTSEPEIILGGCAGNVAAVYAGLGGNVSVIGSVGDDELGQKFVEGTIASGCASSIAVNHEHETSQIMALVDSDKDRTFIILPGANAYVEVPDTSEDDVFCVDGYAWEYEVSRKNIVAELMKRKDAGKLSVIAAEDASVIEMNRELFGELLEDNEHYLFVFSEPEVVALCGPGREPGIEELKKTGARCLVTLGAEGSVVIDRGEVTSVDCVHVPDDEIVDMVGAGDAFLGGFLYGYIKQSHDLVRAAELGSLCASEVVKVTGARLTDFSRLSS